MGIGYNIRKYRMQLKLTQKELAKEIGVEQTTISKYEQGILEPNIEALVKLAKLFGISVDELLNSADDEISGYDVYDILKEQKDMRLKGNLYHFIQIAFAYNSNHIEGSTLTEEQTRNIYETNSALFEENSIVNVNDIIETTNHFRLVDYMLDNAQEDLTEGLIKEFHRILKTGTSDSNKDWFNVGQYKKIENFAGDMKTSSPKNVQKDMRELLDWYNNLELKTIKQIIEFHTRFEKIHPFQDGNGRVGRMIMFKECLRYNIIPFIILDKDKLYYYRGLREYIGNKEKGYLVDTCLNAQDQFRIFLRRFITSV